MNFWHPNTKNEIETDWGCCCAAWAITCLQSLKSTHTSSEDTYTTCQNSILFFVLVFYVMKQIKVCSLCLSLKYDWMNRLKRKMSIVLQASTAHTHTHTIQGGSGAEAAEKSHVHTRTGTCLHLYEGLTRQAKFCDNISYLVTYSF